MNFIRTTVVLAATMLAVVRAADIPIGATNAEISYTPPPGAQSWASIKAPGAFNGSGAFLLGQTDKGVITFKSTQAFIGFKFVGYQRSDGGIYSITFDGGPAQRIDVFNKTSTGSDSPLVLFTATNLPNRPHTVVITNLPDARVGHPGQMNIDHIIITTVDSTPTPPPPPTTSTTTTSSSTSSSVPVPLTTTPDAPVSPTAPSTSSLAPTSGSQVPSPDSPEENQSGGSASTRSVSAAVVSAAFALMFFL